MSDASNVSSNPTGEVRPRSHKLATKQARGGFAMPRERCDDPSAAFERLCVLPHAPDGSILAMVPALSGKCRLRGARLAQPLHRLGQHRLPPDDADDRREGDLPRYYADNYVEGGVLLGGRGLGALKPLLRARVELRDRRRAGDGGAQVLPVEFLLNSGAIGRAHFGSDRAQIGKTNFSGAGRTR
jgi:hypothetical protein